MFVIWIFPLSQLGSRALHRRIVAKLRLEYSARFAPCFGRLTSQKQFTELFFASSPVVTASIPLRMCLILILQFTLNYNIIILGTCQYFFIIFSFLAAVVQMIRKMKMIEFR